MENKDIEKERKIEELFKKSFSYSSNFVLFPVRHHSPLCSFHLENVINEYRPDAILIEGPGNSQDLIPFIVSEKTEAPFCIYMSYDDRKGKIEKEAAGEKYRAFYPFLDYSPEYRALKIGNARGIHTEFIDLSYPEKLLNTEDEKVKSVELIDEDKLFMQSQYCRMLSGKMGCKSFNELWEMLFEINGYHTETKEFVRSLFYYCYYSRENTDYEVLRAEGNIIREYVMAENIRKAMKKYKKVLVVTGGMHTVSLADLITANDLPKYSLKKVKKEEEPSYLMPYSFIEADENYGYQSGMPFPYFYQKLWENLKKENPFEKTVLKFIINTAGIIRKKQPLSISDEMQAFYMAKGLAEIREKRESGVYELIDGVKSSFIKGEITAYNQQALKTLYRLLTGMEVGKVDEKSGIPPIVNDFFEKCKKYRISTTVNTKRETKLDIYNNESHLEKSRFLHQMSFLETNFCSCLKSQDSNTAGKGRILLRETWEYRFSSEVTSNLISNSVFGGTVKDASLSLMIRNIAKNFYNAEELSEILLKANYMGLDAVFDMIFEKLENIIVNEMKFLNISECFKNLNNLKIYNENFNKTLPLLNKIIEICINRILTLIYTVINVRKEEEDKTCDAVKYLYTSLIGGKYEEWEKSFIENISLLREENNINSAIAGIFTGILLKKEKISMEDVMEKFDSFLKGTENSQKMSASFLKGYFKVAKDTVFVSDGMLASLNSILKEADSDLFLEILPDLRLAFTYFMPFEIDKISRKVSSFYSAPAQSVQYGKAFNPKEMERAEEVDRYCGKMLEEWLKE